MRDVKELCEIVENEIGKIVEKGLNTGNLETAYKLIDIYKDIKGTEYWDAKREYYESMSGQSESGGYSGRRGYSREGDSYTSGRSSYGSYANRGQHYVRGHYSRGNGDPYEDYMSEKQSYRSSGKSEDCKQRMLAALEEHMDALTDEIKSMSADADCSEERQAISRFVDKLKRI